MCVIVGLFFFGLAIFTFLLCSWNPKINNTARLHMCLNLAFTHLLMLWNDQYLDSEVTLTRKASKKAKKGNFHILLSPVFNSWPAPSWLASSTSWLWLASFGCCWRLCSSTC